MRPDIMTPREVAADLVGKLDRPHRHAERDMDAVDLLRRRRRRPQRRGGAARLDHRGDREEDRGDEVEAHGRRPPPAAAPAADREPQDLSDPSEGVGVDGAEAEGH